MTRSSRFLATLCSVPVLLAGCGGGGSSSPTTHSLGGTVSGLGASGLMIANGSDTLAVPTGSGTFTMASQVAEGTAYALSVKTQPTGQTCTIASGSGMMGQADVANAVVTCAVITHQVGGSISGLTGAGLVLVNGTDTAPITSGATTFAMPTRVAKGSSYQVAVQTQPAGQNCTVASASGTMADADIGDVAVSCVSVDVPHHIGGTVSGLSASGLVLANGSDTATVASGATTFTMPATAAMGVPYAITVQTQPAGQTCSVTNASGTMASADVGDVAVTCAVNSHGVGGTISGLSAAGLVLGNGSEQLTIASGATQFSLATAVAEGGTYGVSVITQPAGETCNVTGGSGTVGTSDVSNVSVSCSVNTWTLGGTISGLDVTGLVLANGTDTLSVAANATTFTMPAAVPEGSAYAVTVGTQPPYKACTVTNGNGTMGGANVGNVAVACTDFSVTTYIGTANSSGSTDATGTAARLTNPYAVSVRPAGGLIISDTNGYKARLVTTSAVVSTLAGSGTSGNADGTGTAAQFGQLAGSAEDSAGNIYMTDFTNGSVRKITAGGVVTTFASSLLSPVGIVIDSNGDFYVAESGRHQIRKITSTGVMSVLAGSGTSGSSNGTGSAAGFNNPRGLAIDSTGNIYVADVGNHKIRMITPAGVVTTVAGTGTAGSANGAAASATFTNPAGVAVDSSGTVYVADTGNNRIRKISTSGAVTTIAGGSSSGHADGTGATSTFSFPSGIAVDGTGTVYVADYLNSVIRKITP